MNCGKHPEVAAVAFCRSCGRAVCADCREMWQGAAHCADCAAKMVLSSESPFENPAATLEASFEKPPNEAPQLEPPQLEAAAESPRTETASRPYRKLPPAPDSFSVMPIVAAFFGAIPGVGAIVNGQYVKGILHVILFGSAISMAVAVESHSQRELRVFVPLFVMLAVVFFFYMIVDAYRTARDIQRGKPVDEFSGLLGGLRGAGRSPVSGAALIVFGVVFLLNSLGYWELQDILPYWPILMIALGAYLLYRNIVEQSRGLGDGSRSSSGSSLAPLGSVAPRAGETSWEERPGHE